MGRHTHSSSIPPSAPLGELPVTTCGTYAAEAGFRCLTEPVDTTDTTTPAGRMMMQMLGSFAEFERAMIRERTRAESRRPGPRAVSAVDHLSSMALSANAPTALLRMLRCTALLMATDALLLDKTGEKFIDRRSDNFEGSVVMLLVHNLWHPALPIVEPNPIIPVATEGNHTVRRAKGFRIRY